MLVGIGKKEWRKDEAKSKGHLQLTWPGNSFWFWGDPKLHVSYVNRENSEIKKISFTCIINNKK